MQSLLALTLCLSVIAIVSSGLISSESLKPETSSEEIEGIVINLEKKDEHSKFFKKLSSEGKYFKHSCV